METLLKEVDPLLDRLLELGLIVEPCMSEHHCETIETVMEFIGKVRALFLIELKNKSL